MKRLLNLMAWMLTMCFISGTLVAETKIFEKTTTGTPTLKSIQVISFGPAGTLFIGDGAGRQIIAIQTGDTKKLGGISDAIENIDQVMAAKIGTTKDNIEIIDMAVNPASQTAYFAIRKQDDKQYLILTVDKSGTIANFSLKDITYAQIPLPMQEKTVVSAISDIAFVKDILVAAGRANDAFASKILVTKIPFTHESSGDMFSAETYHVAHRRWETKAPMQSLLPYEEDGKAYIIGAFNCTPIVKYPLDALKPGAKVKGISVLELGSGNRPLDMFTYDKSGKASVLTSTFRFHHEKRPISPGPYWTVRFDRDILAENTDINEKALRRIDGKLKSVTERVEMVDTFHGVSQMDRLDESRALVLRTEDNKLNLIPVLLP